MILSSLEVQVEFHLFGIVCGVLALAATVGRFGRESSWGALVLVVLMLGITLFSWLVLLPQIQTLRPAVAGTSLTFARLHAFSVVLNLVTMLAGLMLLLIESFKGRP